MIVAAINGALAPRLDGIQWQMGMLAGQMTSLKFWCGLSAQVQQHDQRMSDFGRQLEDIASGRSSSEHHPDTEACILPEINVQCWWWEVSRTTPGKVGSVEKVSCHTNGLSSGNTRAGSSHTGQSRRHTWDRQKRKSSCLREYHWRSRPCALGRWTGVP